MSINVEVERVGTENNLGVLRRFSRRVQGSGVLPRVRSIRYNKRNESRLTRKKRTLKSIKRKEEFDLLVKLGKIIPKKR